MIVITRFGGVWFANGKPFKSFHDALVSVWPR
jgi:hypothetical protein